MRVFLEASLDKAVSGPRFPVTHATSPLLGFKAV